MNIVSPELGSNPSVSRDLGIGVFTFLYVLDKPANSNVSLALIDENGAEVYVPIQIGSRFMRHDTPYRGAKAVSDTGGQITLLLGLNETFIQDPNNTNNGLASAVSIVDQPIQVEGPAALGVQTASADLENPIAPAMYFDEGGAASWTAYLLQTLTGKGLTTEPRSVKSGALPSPTFTLDVAAFSVVRVNIRFNDGANAITIADAAGDPVALFDLNGTFISNGTIAAGRTDPFYVACGGADRITFSAALGNTWVLALALSPVYCIHKG